MPAYDKADLQRRMHGAVEALKHDLVGPSHRARLDRLARSDQGRGLWRATCRSTRSRPCRRPSRGCCRSRCGTRAMSARSKRRSARPGSGSTRSPTGTMIRLPIPDLTEERRKELAKLAGQYAEKARIAVRNVRRDGMDALKTDEKKHEISEDERKRLEVEVQKMTDDDDQGHRCRGPRQGTGNPRQVSHAPAATPTGRPPVQRTAGRRACRATSRSSWTATAAGRPSAACRASPGIAPAPRRCARRSSRGRGRGRSAHPLRFLVGELAAVARKRSATSTG